MKHWLPKIAFALLWIAIWGLIAFFINSQVVLAGPKEVFLLFLESIKIPTFWVAVATSLWHVALGFVLAMLIGCIFGNTAAKIKLFEDFISPIVSLAKSAPIVCFIVLLLIWFGSNYVDIITITISSCPIFYYSVYEANRTRNINIINMMNTYRICFKDRFKIYEWPHAYPFILQAIKSGIGISWKSGITAQMIAVSVASIGAGVYNSKTNLDTAQLIMWMIVVIILSFICEKIVLLILNWNHKRVTNQKHAYSIAKPCSTKFDICINNLSLKHKSNEILNDVSFMFKNGKRYVLTGQTGCGKTTLINAILGLKKIDNGEIKFQSDGKVLDLDENCRVFSCMFQETSLIPYLNIQNNLLLVNDSINDSKYLSETISDLQLNPSELSGGMKRCAELVRAIEAKSSVVMLDEPFSGLDSKSKKKAINYINERIGNRTLLVITHDEKDANELGCEHLIIKDKSIINLSDHVAN